MRPLKLKYNTSEIVPIPKDTNRWVDMAVHCNTSTSLVRQTGNSGDCIAYFGSYRYAVW